MKEKEMKIIAGWIAQVLAEVKDYRLPEIREERSAYLKKFREDMAKNVTLKEINNEVKELCKKFPVYE